MDSGGHWAVATAGGKDATLALHRAREAGLTVRWGLNIFEGNSGQVRFHGTPRPILEAQLHALGLEPRLQATHPRDFEAVLAGLLTGIKEDGARGVIFGNLHLEEIRAWYESRVLAAGLEHREPLWGQRPLDVVQAVVDEGFQARVVSVNLELGDPDWLGQPLNAELVRRFERSGIDPCGEHGEYHTLVTDGPGFERPLPIRIGGTLEREGHRTLELTLEEIG
jgi:diphthine-ammonia ligase